MAQGLYGAPRPPRPGAHPVEVSSVTVNRVMPGWATVNGRSQSGFWTNNYLHYWPLRVTPGDAPLPISGFVLGAVNIGASTNPQTAYPGLYECDPNTMQPGNLVVASDPVTINAGGFWVASCAETVLVPGRWYLGACVSTGDLGMDWGQPTMPAWSSGICSNGGVPGLWPATVAYTAGALPPKGLAWTAGNGSTYSTPWLSPFGLRPSLTWRQR